MAWTLRPATPADAERLARIITDGFAAYGEFGPPGWEPPSFEGQLALLDEALPQPDVWCLVAEEDGRVAGMVLIRSAAEPPLSDPEPGVAFLWRLFVEPPWFGTGLARELHDLGLEEASRRGYDAIRLFAAAGQARARRFYEREGWVAAGPPFFQASFGMDVVEYRRELTKPRAS
jgi:ribosomal protein S18 acetylase RimI-like enzyme